MRGDFTRKNLGNCGAGERFKAWFRSKCPVSNLILKASLTCIMQYFALISADTGAVAGKVKRKGKDQELMKYLINNCVSFWIIRVCMLVYGLQTVLSLALSVPCPPPPPPPPPQKKRGGVILIFYFLQDFCSNYGMLSLLLHSTISVCREE